uniref:Uncharacterized protein n=1 Tax=Tetradesmus obliquus TaxID=3088 RepID=A0A383V601_TETOB|eukprot:jgi/Sobl393_1/13644/SZX60360.1
MQGLAVLQQPLLHRSFSSSTTAQNRHKPQLHQPQKHVSGTDPLKTLRATNSSSSSWGSSSGSSSSSSSSSAEQQAAEAATAAPEPGTSRVAVFKEAVKQKWQAVCEAAGRLQEQAGALPWRRISFVGMSAGVCITSAVALYEVFQWACMNGSAGNLGSAEPRLQQLAVSRLHALLWRPAGWPLAWPDAASQCQQMADKGLLAQLAALVKPGTEAVVLNEVFQLLQRLLDCDDTMARAMLKVSAAGLAAYAGPQAGVADALGRGLQEGWLPRGAVDTAAALQAKLQSPAGPKQQQQQQQLQRRRLPPAPGAGPAAVTAAVR